MVGILAFQPGRRTDRNVQGAVAPEQAHIPRLNVLRKNDTVLLFANAWHIANHGGGTGNGFLRTESINIAGNHPDELTHQAPTQGENTAGFTFDSCPLGAIARAFPMVAHPSQLIRIDQGVSRRQCLALPHQSRNCHLTDWCIVHVGDCGTGRGGRLLYLTSSIEIADARSQELLHLRLRQRQFSTRDARDICPVRPVDAALPLIQEGTESIGILQSTLHRQGSPLPGIPGKGHAACAARIKVAGIIRCIPECAVSKADPIHHGAIRGVPADTVLCIQAQNHIVADTADGNILRADTSPESQGVRSLCALQDIMPVARAKAISIVPQTAGQNVISRAAFERVITGTAFQHVVTGQSAKHVVAPITDQRVCQAVAGTIDIFFPEFDGFDAMDGIGIGHIRCLPKSIDIQESRHVADQTAPRIGHVKAGQAAVGNIMDSAGKSDGMVGRAVAHMGALSPQPACIDPDDYASPTADQVGSADFAVAVNDIVANLIAVQDRLLCRYARSAQFVRGQVGIIRRPVTTDGQIDHLGFGCWPPGLRQQIGN